MNSIARLDIRVDICRVKGAWVVTFFKGDQSEHRSFRTEAEAREYGVVRMNDIRSRHTGIGLDSKR